MVDPYRLYRHVARCLRHAGVAGVHRQGAGGERRTHVPAGRDRRAVGARKPESLQSAHRQHSGLSDRRQDASPVHGGRADRGGSDIETVPACLTRMRRETVHAYLLLLPAVILLVAFTHWPAIETLIDSFFATPKGARMPPFVGLENYASLLDDPVFWRAMHNNAIYAAATIPLAIVLSLLMALAVNGGLPGRTFLRLAYFLPTMLPMIAVANIWMFFYTPDYGLFDPALA